MEDDDGAVGGVDMPNSDSVTVVHRPFILISLVRPWPTVVVVFVGVAANVVVVVVVATVSQFDSLYNLSLFCFMLISL